MVNGAFSIPLGGPINDSGPTGRRCCGDDDRQGEFIADAENSLLSTLTSARVLIRRGFNPLLLTGPTGVGKSFLAHGLVARWCHESPPAEVVTCSGADFCRLYREAIETDAIDEYRRRLRDADILLIDDITEMAGKEAAQIELANSIDLLLLNKRLIIATSRAAPQRIARLVPQLASRLAQGLVAPVRLPGPAARRELIIRYAALHELPLADESIQWLTRRGPNSASGIRGLLLQVRSSFGGDPASIDAAALQACLEKQQFQEKPTIHSLTKLVARRFRLKVTDLRSSSRRQAVVRARGLAMYLARQYTDLSLERLGEYFGKRDHTTVLHACRQTEQRIANQPQLKEAVEDIINQLAGSPSGTS